MAGPDQEAAAVVPADGLLEESLSETEATSVQPEEPDTAESSPKDAIVSPRCGICRRSRLPFSYRIGFSKQSLSLQTPSICKMLTSFGQPEYLVHLLPCVLICVVLWCRTPEKATAGGQQMSSAALRYAR